MTFVADLYSHRIVQSWLRDKPEGWELISGDWSPFYFSFRDVPSYPVLLRASIELLQTIIPDRVEQFDQVIGIASAGVPLAAIVASNLEIPMGFTRKVAGIRTIEDLAQHTSEWGGHSTVEGRFKDGDRLLLIDDVVTGGASKQVAVEMVRHEAERRGIDLDVVGIAVVIDRGLGDHRNLDVPLVSAIRLVDHIGEFAEGGATPREVEIISEYIKDPEAFQEIPRREALIEEARAWRAGHRS